MRVEESPEAQSDDENSKQHQPSGDAATSLSELVGQLDSAASEAAPLRVTLVGWCDVIQNSEFMN